MLWLPTLSVETFNLSDLWSISQRWDRTSSSDERLTLMEELTCTSLQISNGSFEVDRLLYLMWTVTTRTSHLVRVHQRRVTTMRSRMETLSEGLSQDLNPAELEMGRLAINGLSLRMQRLVTSFGSWLTNWIRSLQSALSTNSRNGATGDLHLYALPISTHEELNLWSRTMTEDIRGYCNLALDLENHS